MTQRLITTLAICLFIVTSCFSQSYSYYFNKGLDLFESDCQDAAFSTWSLGAVNNEIEAVWLQSTAYSMNGAHHSIEIKAMP